MKMSDDCASAAHGVAPATANAAHAMNRFIGAPPATQVGGSVRQQPLRERIKSVRFHRQFPHSGELQIIRFRRASDRGRLPAPDRSTRWAAYDPWSAYDPSAAYDPSS